MIAEIGAGLGSLKAAMDLAKSLNAANTQAAINGIKIELQSRIIVAQEALAAAREADSASAQRIRELEQQIVQFEDWETEKQRYELRAIADTGFAYMPKAGMENGEPPHWLCTNCFDKRQKSILQRQGQVGSNAIWQCNRCSGKMGLFASHRPGG